MSYKPDQRIQTKSELEEEKKRINDEALQIMDNNFQESGGGTSFKRMSTVMPSGLNLDKLKKKTKDGEYEGMMKIISET